MYSDKENPAGPLISVNNFIKANLKIDSLVANYIIDMEAVKTSDNVNLECIMLRCCRSDYQRLYIIW